MQSWSCCDIRDVGYDGVLEWPISHFRGGGDTFLRIEADSELRAEPDYPLCVLREAAFLVGEQCMWRLTRRAIKTFNMLHADSRQLLPAGLVRLPWAHPAELAGRSPRILVKFDLYRRVGAGELHRIFRRALGRDPTSVICEFHGGGVVSRRFGAGITEIYPHVPPADRKSVWEYGEFRMGTRSEHVHTIDVGSSSFESLKRIAFTATYAAYPHQHRACIVGAELQGEWGRPPRRNDATDLLIVDKLAAGEPWQGSPVYTITFDGKSGIDPGQRQRLIISAHNPSDGDVLISVIGIGVRSYSSARM